MFAVRLLGSLDKTPYEHRGTAGCNGRKMLMGAANSQVFR